MIFIHHYIINNIIIIFYLDPDTVDVDKTRVSYTDGKVYDLVMSDEFNKAGRTFKDGNSILNYLPFTF